MDITKYKQAEENLRESEGKYRAILESIEEGYYELDIAGNFTFFNDSMCRILGYSKEEVLGLNYRAYTAKKDVETVYKTYNEVYRTGKSVSGASWEAFRKDGSRGFFEASISLLHDSAGEIVGFKGLVRDITERKRAEEQLLIAATVIKTCVSAIATADLNGRLTYVNPAFLRMWGYDDDKEVVGRNIVEFLQIQMKEKAAEVIRAIFEKGGWLEELIGKRKDGSIFDVQLSASMVTGEGDSSAYMLAFFLDITERKQAEEEIKQSLQRLRKAMDGAVQAIALIVEMRDPCTAGHQQRVTKLACAIAEEMDLPESQIDGVRVSAAIHDIGKIYVPAEILSKPGGLTDSEFGMIRSRPQVGYDILKEIEFAWPVAQIVFQHHERMDGSGYPEGLVGEDILTEARILAVADVVEAMASHRPYRPVLGIEKALEEISQNKGVLYDSEVVDVCLRLFTEKGFEFD